MANRTSSSRNENRPMSSAARARERIRRRKEQERRRKMQILACTLAGLVLLGVVAIVALSAYFKADDYDDKVYPNIYAAGVELSGMTEEEARIAIEEAAAKYYQENKIDLTYGNDVLPIYGSDVGMKVDAISAAREAVNYGKDLEGKDQRKLLKGKAGRIDIPTVGSYDDALLLAKVEEFATMVEDKISVNSYELTELSVKIDLSNNGYVLDIATIHNDLGEKLLAGDFTEYLATPVQMTPQNLKIEEIYQSVFVEPKDAYMEYVPAEWGTEETLEGFDMANYTGKLKYRIQPETVGISFDLEAAKAELASAGDKKVFEFLLIKTNPQVTTESLKNAIYKNVLSSVTTKLTSERNRTANVKLASQSVNGFELMPGEVFSFNNVVGQRTEARGFKKAGTFVKGEVVDEIGGGICQVSSTIYMATLLTNLEQVERAPHRFAVTYTPLGQDATVYWGSLDYRFKNDTDYPIKILAEVSGSSLTVKVLGTKTDSYKYKLSTTTNSTKEFKEETKYIALGGEEALEYELEKLGEKKVTGGKKGYTCSTYLITYDENGTEVSRKKVNDSSYKTQDKVTYIACFLNEKGEPILDEKGEPMDPNAPVTSEPTTTTPNTPSTEPTTKPEPPTSEPETTTKPEPPTSETETSPSTEEPDVGDGAGQADPGSR
ncbi:MAG: VanW family protein [Clostridia bacterium]|nr:VanW family protein [Clostridia bacterium]